MTANLRFVGSESIGRELASRCSFGTRGCSGRVGHLAQAEPMLFI